MTKEENMKEEPEVVKSRSTRHALARVLKAVQLQLPPDGISERDAMGMIIEAVDPMPDDFDSEKCIKEVMELIELFANACEHDQAASYFGGVASPLSVQSAREAIEAKLRQLIQ